MYMYTVLYQYEAYCVLCSCLVSQASKSAGWLKAVMWLLIIWDSRSCELAVLLLVAGVAFRLLNVPCSTQVYA